MKRIALNFLPGVSGLFLPGKKNSICPLNKINALKKKRSTLNECNEYPEKF